MSSAVNVAREKVKRVLVKRDAFHNCLFNYFRSKPHRVVTDPDGEQKLEITESPPIELSLILGEMLYQLRSALDHLFFELVKRNHGECSLDPKWVRKCQFPILTELPSGVPKPPAPRKGFDRFMQGVLTDDVFAFIEGVQPYHPERRAGDLLLLLSELSNIDKHRHLNRTDVFVTHVQTAVTSEGETCKAVLPWLQSGAKIETIAATPSEKARGVELIDEFTPQILTQGRDSGHPRHHPIELIVDEFPLFMFNFMIPSFERLIDNRSLEENPFDYVPAPIMYGRTRF